MMTNERPLAITMGDSSGVGPEIALVAAVKGEVAGPFVIVGDYRVLEACNERLRIGAVLRRASSPGDLDASAVNVLDQELVAAADVRIGELSEASGRAALAYVARATDLALDGSVAAMVTLPINKAATRLSHPTFTGHTEYVAERCGRSSSTLMLVSERAIATHVSTHVSLRQALDAVRTERVFEVIQQTDDILGRLRPARRIAVAGLNPHAGEGGAFGDEDRLEIAPAVARARAAGIEATGPLPPDTVFLDMMAGRFDAVVCMYHDQGHIPMKVVDFRGGVNVTLGLPIVRTSVDHGTAFDIAWQGKAFTDSLRDACRVARLLAS
jgi:4-hydroxythreonine-4-phosphate dehydrogenase